MKYCAHDTLVNMHASNFLYYLYMESRNVFENTIHKVGIFTKDFDECCT